MQPLANVAVPVGVQTKSDSVNAEYFKKLGDAMLIITKHWPDIKEAATLGLTPEAHGVYQLAGHQAALGAASYAASMAASQEAAGGLSIFSLAATKEVSSTDSRSPVYFFFIVAVSLARNSRCQSLSNALTSECSACNILNLLLFFAQSQSLLVSMF